MTKTLRVTRAQALRRETLRKLRQVGWWGTLKHGSGKVVREVRQWGSPRTRESDPFDATYGTNTGGVLGVGSLDIPEDRMEHSTGYGAITEEEFTRLMKELSITGEGLTFIDLGAGKGRALLLASFYPFTEIVGVELSQMLHQIAQSNIRAFGDPRQRCHNVRSVCEDASTWEIPENPILVFMHNPFDEAVMRRVCSHLERSIDCAPREVYVWYIKPECRQVFDSSPHFELLKDTGRYVFYRASAGKGTPAQKS